MSTLSDLTPAQEYAFVAGRFTELTESAATADWDRPSPVPGWTARDVVRHLIEWFPAFLQGGTGIELPSVPHLDHDPAAAWSERSREVAALLDEPGDRQLSDRHIGTVPLADAIDQFYTADVFMHTWDLARALGTDPQLDPARCERFLAGAEPYEEAMRSSGQYGPRVDVDPDAPAQDRLAGFIGRDPAWQQ